MKKLFLTLAVILGFTATASSQTTTTKDGIWDVISYDGQILMLREEAPGKIVINTHDWGTTMKFPVHISHGVDTLEYLVDASMVEFGAVTLFLEPYNVTSTGLREYGFLIFSGPVAGKTTWWIQKYVPNKNPGA